MFITIPKKPRTDLWTFLRDTYPPEKIRVNDQKMTVIIDDRNPNDVYPGFCDVNVTVSTQRDIFDLVLSHAPLNLYVKGVVKDLGGRLTDNNALGGIIELTLSLDHVSRIRELAKTIRHVIGRGETYPERNWKWIVPRTAKSLESFARHMALFKRTHRKTPIWAVSRE